MEQLLQIQKQLRDMQLQVRDLERENQTLRATRKAGVTIELEEDGFVNVKVPHESLTDSGRSKKTLGERIIRVREFLVFEYICLCRSLLGRVSFSALCR